MLDLMLTRSSRLLILGDWITHFSYAVMEEGQIFLDTFEEGDTASGNGEPERTGVSIAF
jgi:UDP-2,3-diacylglucosamine hydrolase